MKEASNGKKRLHAALSYATRGFPVIPITNGKKKPPLINGWPERASTDPATIKKWWKEWPSANIGVLTGSRSKLLVVDVDRHKADGFKTLKALIKKHGPIPRTLTSTTPNKGRHLFFTTEEHFKSGTASLGPGVDIRSEAGYVVVAPSIVDGKRYVWSTAEIAILPDWIAEHLRNSSSKEKPKVAGPPEIAEGERNTTLTSYAGSMRQRNLPPSEIEERLHQINLEQCKPPLSHAEVQLIVRSVLRYEPASADLFQLTRNDAGNADRLVNTAKDYLRFVRRSDFAIRYEKTSWERIALEDVVEHAKSVMRHLATEAEACSDTGLKEAMRTHAAHSLNQARLRAMCELARWDPRLRIDEEQLDAKPLLLGVKNGVLNLKTGKLCKPRPGQLITRGAPVPYDPNADCPRFKAFLVDVAGGDSEYCRYLVRLLGYLLTGDTSEQKFFFLYGTGANGKTTFLSVIRMLLGPEMVTALPPDALMFKSRGRSATNDLARLNGMRVVISNEIEEGAQFDETLVKALTGGDLITARYLFKEFFDFVPRFKLLIAGNHQPIIKGDDVGIWRRVQLLPFKAEIPEDKRDPYLLRKLRKELPGILALAVRGCRRWQKNGLRPPTVVTSASEVYREEMDLFGRWIRECAQRKRGESWPANEAYASYSNWAQANGLTPMSNAAFGRKIKSRFASKRLSSGIFYEGLTAKSKD